VRLDLLLLLLKPRALVAPGLVAVLALQQRPSSPRALFSLLLAKGISITSVAIFLIVTIIISTLIVVITGTRQLPSLVT
jgi:hypothetical protein